MQTRKPKYISLGLWLLFFLAAAGCREEFSAIPFNSAANTKLAIAQDSPQPESPAEENQTPPPPTESPEDRPAAIPASYRLLPPPEREAVFDALLGPNTDAYFVQEQRGETFVVLNDQALPIRLGWAGRLGGKEGAVLILLGMSVSPQNASIEKVYTFETGTAASLRPYQADKHDFLKQFENKQVFEKPDTIHGITGATPIWKPIAARIQEIREDLLKKKSDPDWLAAVKSRGFLWRRNKKTAAVPFPQAQSAPQIDPTPKSPSENSQTSANLESNPPAAEAVPEEPALEIPEAFPDEPFLSGSTPNTVLYEHWKGIAAVEITILVCGLLIVLTAQIKRIVYP